MVYQYHRVNKFETLEDILILYNMDIFTIINLNKLRYPSLIINPYMIFEGWLLMVVVMNPEEEAV